MVKLNLGCGPHALPGWVNYDMQAHPGVIPLDLSLARLPHADNSVDLISSEHFIEHLTYERCLELMRECHRVLSPGLPIRISTPDLEKLCTMYLSGKVVSMPGTWEPATPCQMVNEGMRLWGHEFIYDYRQLYSTLRIAGFSGMVRCLYRESQYSTGLDDLEVRPPHIDLIMEAIK